MREDGARFGRGSKGWFYGFKLHLVINDCGELLALRLTPGDTDDRQPVPQLVKELFSKLFGDKGYISQPLFETLYDDGLQLVTKIKRGELDYSSSPCELDALLLGG